MLSRRNVFTSFSISLTALLLFQFQNCAPTGSSAPVSSSSGGSHVRIVDDLSKAELQFASTEVQVHDQAQIGIVSGLCSRTRNGSQLKWTILAPAGATPLFAGDAECTRGQFGVKLAALDQIQCGVQHILVLEGDWGGVASTSVTRRCRPVAEEQTEAPEGSPLGTECSIEYKSAQADAAECTQVCYRDMKVVLQSPVENELCAAMASRLAGQ